MPSNHTYLIEEGCSFQDFVFSCAKAFDYLSTMRESPADTPIPDIIRVDPYYAKKAAECLKVWRQWKSATLENVRETRALIAANRQRSQQASQATDQEKQERYAAMRAQVEAWKPPTPDHESLKHYMLSQIGRSARGLAFPHDELQPVEQTDQEWLAEQTADAQKSYEAASAQYLEACERARLCTEWVRQLKKSLSG